MECLSVSIHWAQQHLEEEDTLRKLKRNNVSNFWICKLFNYYLFTFWSFCCKLRVKIKRIFRSASCRFKRGMNFSPVQFLKKRHRPEWIKKLYDTTKHLTKKFTELILKKILTFQSIFEKNACLLISSTPSGPAPFIRKKNLCEFSSSWSKEWVAKLYFLFPLH